MDAVSAIFREVLSDKIGGLGIQEIRSYRTIKAEFFQFLDQLAFAFLNEKDIF